jgi:acyl dehydratase
VAHQIRCALEHVSIRVKDIGWHIRFFRDVLGMPVHETVSVAEQPQQVWILGGVLLVADPNSTADDRRPTCFGVVAEDAEAIILKAKAHGVSAPRDEPMSLALPDGIVIKVAQAALGAVGSLLAVKTRPDRKVPTVAPVVERYYEEVAVGDVGSTPSVTITEEHVLTYAALTGDYSPEHMDEEFARSTPFGARVAHGLFGLSLADGLRTQSQYRLFPGISLGWTWDFIAPLKFGDTVHVDFKISSMRTTKKAGWGILTIPSELINEDGTVIQRGEHRLMIPKRPD